MKENNNDAGKEMRNNRPKAIEKTGKDGREYSFDNNKALRKRKEKVNDTGKP